MRPSDAGLGCNHANFAKLCTCHSATMIGDNVRLVSQLPDVRGFPAVHLEGVRRWAELNHQDIDVLTHILITKARGNFLFRCRAATQRTAPRLLKNALKAPKSNGHSTATAGRRQYCSHKRPTSFRNREIVKNCKSVASGGGRGRLFRLVDRGGSSQRRTRSWLGESLCEAAAVALVAAIV